METAKEIKLFQVIGNNIKKYRNNSSRNQAHLASQVGLSRTSMVNIEQGKQQPSLVLLWKIAEALGVELHELFPKHSDLAEISDISTPPAPYVTNKEMTDHRLAMFNQKVNEAMNAQP